MKGELIMTDDLNHIMDHNFQQEDLTDFDSMDLGDIKNWDNTNWDSDHWDSDIDNINNPIGDPDGSGYFQQSTGFTCAVVAQQMVLHDFGITDPATGMCPSEAQLTYVATANGWLHGGTLPDDLGRLLDYYGVDSHHGQGIESMVEELSQGHKVVVGIDADELWYQDNFVINDLKDALGGEAANHAIVVKGIKFDEHGDPLVVVNDPGIHNGAGMEYSLDTFVNAFEDSDFHYVATDTAPPNLGNDAVFGLNFNTNKGYYDGSENWISASFEDSENYEINYFSLKNLTELSSQERLNIFNII